MNKWYDSASAFDNPIILSSSIKLSRNLHKYKFLPAMNNVEKNEIVKIIRFALENETFEDVKTLFFVQISELPIEVRLSFAEKQLISTAFANVSHPHGMFISDDNSISVLINESDHIKIWTTEVGIELDRSLKKIAQIENFLDKKFGFAFDTQLGYLTSSPSELGTGMRANCVLHLPALETMGAIPKISNTISNLGFVIRGTFDDTSHPKGAFFTVSNKVTLGIGERNACKNLEIIANQISVQEQNSRNSLDNYDLCDRAYRAYGILKYARLLSHEDLIELVSLVILGISQKILTDIPMEKISSLLYETGSNTIITNFGDDLSEFEENKIRASIVRKRLNS